ncbi:hypothetical protein [Holophaga foetida]|uniref:hypothetical protein n=1 Tax=Holophaga foetida TaxID=35839 RepID=UPI0002473F0C|nr:hypothetical protein [Holophaga foetida]
MSVDGTYKIVSKTPVGDQPATLTLKVEGEVLTGSSASDLEGVAPVLDGKVSGNTFTFSLCPKSPYGDLKLELSGKVEGDTISGDVNSMFGPATFTGTRI